MKLRSLSILLLAASCAGPPRAFPVRTPNGDLQPLDIGLEWIYDVDGKTQIRRVVGTELLGRFECRVVEARTGPVVERFWMRWEKERLKVYRVSDGQSAVDFDDPVVQINRLAGPGQPWDFEETHGPVTLAVQGMYEGDDEFKLGLKTYKSSRIRLVKRVAGRVVVDQTCWYVMDIGLVRMSVVVAGDEGETRTKLKLKSCNFLPD
jgi:hypothetical protein